MLINSRLIVNGWGFFGSLVVLINFVRTYSTMYMICCHIALSEALLVFVISNVEQTATIGSFNWKCNIARARIGLKRANFTLTVSTFSSTQALTIDANVVKTLIIFLPFHSRLQPWDRLRRLESQVSWRIFWCAQLLHNQTGHYGTLSAVVLHTTEPPVANGITAHIWGCRFWVFAHAWMFQDHVFHLRQFFQTFARDQWTHFPSAYLLCQTPRQIRVESAQSSYAEHTCESH